MNRTIYTDSPDYQRIHTLPRVKGACAVHLVYTGHSIVVKLDTLMKSVASATGIALKLIRDDDHNPNRSGLPSCATLRPITAKQVNALRDGAELIDTAQEKVMFDQCVLTCYEVIRDCPDPAVRLEAAQLLRELGHTQWSKR